MTGLMIHTGKAEAATFEDLVNIPTPMALGRIHKPVPHAELVRAIRSEAEARDILIKRETFGLSKNGAKLFATMDLVLRGGDAGLDEMLRGRRMMLGFRSSNDQKFALAGVAGSRVTVCDNMLLSGDTFAWDKKHTLGVDLAALIRTGFDRFLGQHALLEKSVRALEVLPLADSDAKVCIYDVFAAGVLPARLFDDVHGLYFQPTDETPDTQPRTHFGLHNAFTRAMKQLKPTVAFDATIRLGRAFGLRTAAEE
jgi:hypothetical protein